MGGPVHSPQKEQISPTHPFLDRKTLETPYSSPLLIVLICKLFNFTEVTVAWNRVFPCSCIVILNQVRSVVKKQLTNKRNYLCRWLFKKGGRLFHARVPAEAHPPSGGGKLNLSIKEHRGMMEKLKGTLKNVKERDSTVCQSHGLALSRAKNLSTVST